MEPGLKWNKIVLAAKITLFHFQTSRLKSNKAIIILAAK